MTTETNWITSELKRLFPRADLTVGVDLNGNGRLDDNEKIATFNNNKIPGNKANVIGDWTDWLAFYRQNVAQLAKLDQGKSIFALSARFKATNPLHTVTTIESGMSTLEKVRKTYETVATIYAKMKIQDQKSPTPPEKFLDLYAIIRAQKISIDGDNQVVLLLDGLNAKTLDCDTSGFIISAIAYEMGWPVFLVHLPAHTFVRWDNGKRGQGGVRLNYDYDGPFTDLYYQQKFNVLTISVSQQVYLQNLDEKQTVALIVSNRGNAKNMLGKYEEAIEDYNEALRLNPQYAETYYNRGIARQMIGKHREAIGDYDEAIRVNPNYTDAYNNRGGAHHRLGKHQHAIKDFGEAIRINPKYASAYNNRGFVKYGLRKYHDAIKDYDEAIRLNPTYATAYNNRGKAKQKLGRTQEAKKDFEKAELLSQ